MLQTAVQLCGLFGRQAGPESTFASLSRLQQTSENARIVNQADLYHDSQGREVPCSLKRSKVSVDIFPRRDFSRYEDEMLAEQTCCDVLVHVALYQTISETRGVPVRGLNWPSYEDDVKIQEGCDNASKAKTAQPRLHMETLIPSSHHLVQVTDAALLAAPGLDEQNINICQLQVRK